MNPLNRFSRLFLLSVISFAILGQPTNLMAEPRDTPLGVEFVAANFPDSTVEECVVAAQNIAEIGSHASFIWHWDNRDFINGGSGLVTVIKEQGLKVLLQMGTTFLGDPNPPRGFEKSFADPTTRALFLLDLEKLAEMKPDYLIISTEANIMFKFNREEFENFRSLYTEGYNLVKRISPDTSVGASFLYSLWFAQYHFDDDDVPSLLEPADFYAFTSYPEWLIDEGHYTGPSDIPVQWYGFSSNAYPEKRLVFSEVGWANDGPGDLEVQAEYISNLPRLMSYAKPELVTWALLHDVDFFTRNLLTDETVLFLEDLGVNIDELFSRFNAMGLRNGDGTTKPAWDAAINLDFNNP